METFTVSLIFDNVLFGFLCCTVFADGLPSWPERRWWSRWAAAVGFRSIKLVHVCCLRVHKFVCVYFATMAMVLLLTSTIHIINLSNIFLYNCQSLLLRHERTTFIPLCSPFLIKSFSKGLFYRRARFIENNLTTKLIEF